MNEADFLVTQMLLFPGKGLVLVCPSPVVAKRFMAKVKERSAAPPWARAGGNRIVLPADPEPKGPE